jgi:hypothetical protein
MGPIDYSLQGIQSPAQALMQGVQFGAGLSQLQAQRQAAEAQAAAQQAALDRQQRFQGALQSFFANPNRKFEDLEAVLPFADKQQFEGLKLIAERMDKRTGDASKQFYGQLLAAIELDPNQAKTMLDQRIEAEQNPQNKQALTVARKSLDIDPKMAANSIELIGGASFGKDWYESIAKVREERRKAALAPLEFRRQTAEATIKEAEAKFAPDKFGAELGLTQAQIEAAKAARRASDAAAAKSGAEASRASAEAGQITAGIIPADKRPEAEGKFRKEYNDQTAGYREVKSAYGRVLSSEDTAVGDLSLIFGYMKMLDPGSVVREGEFATAQNAAGVPERIQNIYNRVVSGERLSKSQRDSFKGQAEKLYKSAGDQEATVRTGIERIAKGYGLNTANIFYAGQEAAPTAPPSPATPPAVSGRRNIVVEY